MQIIVCIYPLFALLILALSLAKILVMSFVEIAPVIIPIANAAAATRVVKALSKKLPVLPLKAWDIV